jgi:hypothetical protein
MNTKNKYKYKDVRLIAYSFLDELKISRILQIILFIWHSLQNKANNRISWNAVYVHMSIIPTWTNISSCLSYETDVDDTLVKDSQRNKIVFRFACLLFIKANQKLKAVY